MTVDPVWDENEEPIGEPEDGHIVPKGAFRPTPRRPLPGQQCTATVKNGAHAGERCRRRAIYGHWICMMHGGNAPAVRKKAEATVRDARMRLLDSVDAATDVVEDLMHNAVSEAVRLKAATEIWDRVGLRGGQELDITVSQGADPATVLRERLSLLKARQMEDVIEGEVVDPAEDDVTLNESADNDLPEEPRHG